jgi:AbiV family abortive infection protein
MNFNHLKVEDIEKIFLKIYENACELLEEAELLYNHNKFARAYLCAHIAFEEFGKLPMLNTVAINVNMGFQIDWNKLNRRIRDHKSKISQSYTTITYFLQKIEEQAKGYKAELDNTANIFNFEELKFEEIVSFIKNEFKIDSKGFAEYVDNILNLDELNTSFSMAVLLNDFKNSSLYADFDKSEFLKPSECIDIEICEACIILALIQKKVIEAPNIHKLGFRLSNLTQSEKNKLENLNNWYLETLRQEKNSNKSKK